jgi:hypothetical protein
MRSNMRRCERQGKDPLTTQGLAKLLVKHFSQEEGRVGVNSSDTAYASTFHNLATGQA